VNDNDEATFVASVRRGRDLLDVLYFWNGRRLQRVLAEGDRLLRIGGTMDKIGGAALNNSGVIAFPGAIFKGPTLGGIFVAGTRDLRLLAEHSAGHRKACATRRTPRSFVDGSGRRRRLLHVDRPLDLGVAGNLSRVPITALADSELHRIVLDAFADWERHSAEARLTGPLDADAAQQALTVLADDAAAVSGALSDDSVWEVGCYSGAHGRLSLEVSAV
jgi:hypothetical protein